MSEQAPAAEAPTGAPAAPELPAHAVPAATRLEAMSKGLGRPHALTQYEPLDGREAGRKPARRPAHKAKPVTYEPYDEG